MSHEVLNSFQGIDRNCSRQISGFLFFSYRLIVLPVPMLICCSAMLSLIYDILFIPTPMLYYHINDLNSKYGLHYHENRFHFVILS